MPDPITDGPVLLVGSGRSGTSILTLALQRGADIRGFAEGHVLDAYAPLADAVNRFYGRKGAAAQNERHALSHVPAEALKADIAGLLLARMDAIHGGSRWLDKTGGAAMLEFVAAAATGTRRFATIFLYRRAIENVVSRLAKFAQHDVAAHASDWARIMSRWRAVRGTLAPDSFIEIEHRELVEQPAQVAARAAALLGVPDRAERIADILRSRRRQQLASDAIGRVLTLAGLAWSDADKAQFTERVDAEMRAWGFTYDGSYRSVLPLPPAGEGRGEGQGA